MRSAPGMRDLAHCLLAFEAGATKTSEPMESATLRVYEKLRQSLSAFAGVAAFEDLLLEIDRLRNVSEHIETLADRHPGMEDGLVSAAGNIRGIATVLDIFTLIRSKAGGPQDEVPDLQTNRYMN